MEAKRCDRCRKFYFPSDETIKYNNAIIDLASANEAQEYEGVTFNDTVMTLSYNATSYSGKSCVNRLGKRTYNVDLCPLCASSFISWLKDIK